MIGLGCFFLPDLAHGQGIGVISDGLALDVTPTVSADRRYARLGLNAGFSTVNGFQTFPVPAAVNGGGAGGFGAVAGGGGINANNGFAGGLFGPGARANVPRSVDYSVGVSPFGASFARYMESAPTDVSPRIVRGKTSVRSRRRAR